MERAACARGPTSPAGRHPPPTTSQEPQFTTPDTIRPAGPGTTNYNPYTYTTNNPTTWTDPTGHFVDWNSTTQGAAQSISPTVDATMAAAPLGVGQKLAAVLTIALEVAATALHALTTTQQDGPEPDRPPTPQPGPTTQPHIDPIPPGTDNKCRAPNQGDDCDADAVYVSGNDQSETTAHIRAAILTGKPARLHYLSSAGKVAADISHGWYDRSANRPNACCNRDGQVCDEYPFFSTVEGFNGTNAANISLQPVARAEGNRQRDTLSRSYFGPCKASTRSEGFAVATDPTEPTYAMCDGQKFVL